MNKREYYPECRCDPRRPLNPLIDHEKSCPARKQKEIDKKLDAEREASMEGGE